MSAIRTLLPNDRPLVWASFSSIHRAAPSNKREGSSQGRVMGGVWSVRHNIREVRENLFCLVVQGTSALVRKAWKLERLSLEQWELVARLVHTLGDRKADKIGKPPDSPTPLLLANLHHTSQRFPSLPKLYHCGGPCIRTHEPVGNIYPQTIIVNNI